MKQKLQPSCSEAKVDTSIQNFGYTRFVAACTATEQIIDLKLTLQYMGIPVNRSVMFGDNQSVVTSSSIPIQHCQNDGQLCPIIMYVKQSPQSFMSSSIVKFMKSSLITSLFLFLQCEHPLIGVMDAAVLLDNCCGLCQVNNRFYKVVLSNSGW